MQTNNYGMIDIKDLQQQPEGQLFDRKSFRIDAKALGVILVAFANADGGDVVIGIEDDGRITGVNGNEEHLNELLRTPFDFCVPSVNVEVHFVDCTDINGLPNRVLVMHVAPSMKVHANQAEDDLFVTIPQYPPFCWTELIVNAVAHRDYSILGTDIMVKIFDHHYVVESPGILPGMVRIDNIRQMHFSRNPKIVQFMQQYKLVKEFGEGVDRMFREMAEAGNPDPEYKQVEFMVKVRLNSALREETVEESREESREKSREKIMLMMKEHSGITQSELAESLKISVKAVEKHIKNLREHGIIRRVGPDKGGHWEVIEPKEKEGE